jgi:hypothetical protein
MYYERLPVPGGSKEIYVEYSMIFRPPPEYYTVAKYSLLTNSIMG